MQQAFETQSPSKSLSQQQLALHGSQKSIVSRLQQVSRQSHNSGRGLETSIKIESLIDVDETYEKEMLRCSTRMEEVPSADAFTAADPAGNAMVHTAKRSVAFERSNKNQVEPMSPVDYQIVQSTSPAQAASGDDEEFEDEEDAEGMLLYQRHDGPHKVTRSRFFGSKYKKNRQMKINQYKGEPSELDYLDKNHEQMLQMQYSMEYQSLIQTKVLPSQQSLSHFNSSISVPRMSNLAIQANSQENLAHSQITEKDLFNAPQTTAQSFEQQQRPAKVNASTCIEDHESTFDQYVTANFDDKAFLAPEINRVTKLSSRQSPRPSSSNLSHSESLQYQTLPFGQFQKPYHNQGGYTYLVKRDVPIKTSSRRALNSAIAGQSLRRQHFEEVYMKRENSKDLQASPAPKFISLRIQPAFPQSAVPQEETLEQQAPQYDDVSYHIHQSFKPSRVIQNHPTLLLNRRIDAKTNRRLQQKLQAKRLNLKSSPCDKKLRTQSLTGVKVDLVPKTNQHTAEVRKFQSNSSTLKPSSQVVANPDEVAQGLNSLRKLPQNPPTQEDAAGATQDGIGCQADFQEDLDESVDYTTANQASTRSPLKVTQQSSELYTRVLPMSGLINVASLSGKRPTYYNLDRGTKQSDDGVETAFQTTFDNVGKPATAGAEEKMLKKDPSIATNESSRKRTTVVSLRSQKTFQKLPHQADQAASQNKKKVEEPKKISLPVDQENITNSEEELQVSEDENDLRLINSPMHKNMDTQSEVEIASPSPFMSLADKVRESQRRFTMISPQIDHKMAIDKSSQQIKTQTTQSFMIDDALKSTGSPPRSKARHSDRLCRHHGDLAHLQQQQQQLDESLPQGQKRQPRKLRKGIKRHRSLKERKMRREIRKKFEHQIRPSSVVTGGEARVNHEASMRQVRYVPLTTMQIKAYELSLNEIRQENGTSPTGARHQQRMKRISLRGNQMRKSDFYNKQGSLCITTQMTQGNVLNSSTDHQVRNDESLSLPQESSAKIVDQPDAKVSTGHLLSESNQEVSGNDESDSFLQRTPKALRRSQKQKHQQHSKPSTREPYQHRYEQGKEDEDDQELVIGQDPEHHSQSAQIVVQSSTKHKTGHKLILAEYSSERTEMLQQNQTDKPPHLDLSMQRFSTENDENFASAQSQQNPIVKEQELLKQQIPYGGEPMITTELQSESDNIVQLGETSSKLVTPDLHLLKDPSDAVSSIHQAGDLDNQSLFFTRKVSNFAYGSPQKLLAQSSNPAMAQDNHGRRSVFQRSYYKDSENKNMQLNQNSQTLLIDDDEKQKQQKQMNIIVPQMLDKSDSSDLAKEGIDGKDMVAWDKKRKQLANQDQSQRQRVNHDSAQSAAQTIDIQTPKLFKQNSSQQPAQDVVMHCNQIKLNKQSSAARSTLASRKGKQLSASPVNKDLIAVIQQPKTALNMALRASNSTNKSIGGDNSSGPTDPPPQINRRSTIHLPLKASGEQDSLSRDQNSALLRGPIVEVSILAKSSMNKTAQSFATKKAEKLHENDTKNDKNQRVVRTAMQKRRPSKNSYYHHFAAFPEQTIISIDNSKDSIEKSQTEETFYFKKRNSAAKTLERKLKQNLRIKSMQGTQALPSPEKVTVSSQPKLKKQSKRSSYERLSKKVSIEQQVMAVQEEEEEVDKSGTKTLVFSRANAAVNPVLNLSGKLNQQKLKHQPKLIDQFRNVRVKDRKRQQYASAGTAYFQQSKERQQQRTSISTDMVNSQLQSSVASNLLLSLEQQHQATVSMKQLLNAPPAMNVDGVVALRSTFGTYQGRRSRDMPLLAPSIPIAKEKQSTQQQQSLQLQRLSYPKSSLQIVNSTGLDGSDAMSYLKNNQIQSSSVEQLKPMTIYSENTFAVDLDRKQTMNQFAKAMQARKDVRREDSLQLVRQLTTSQIDKFSTSQESINYPFNQRLTQIGPMLFDQKSDEMSLTATLPIKKKNTTVEQKPEQDKILSININTNQKEEQDRRDSHTFYIEDEKDAPPRSSQTTAYNQARNGKQPLKVVVPRNKYGSEAVTPPEELLSEPLSAMNPISNININYQGAEQGDEPTDGPGTEAMVSTTNQKRAESGAAGPSIDTLKASSQNTNVYQDGFGQQVNYAKNHITAYSKKPTKS